MKTLLLPNPSRLSLLKARNIINHSGSDLYDMVWGNQSFREHLTGAKKLELYITCKQWEVSEISLEMNTEMYFKGAFNFSDD